ncbi:hypothetical protein [Streptomyces camelliae]|uniref:Lipoprotein n=1 Tax=Streptomyces camelliae TaxID=3004093 RepID=A0ABY7P4C7_9ACTN|nr:hypothetical protein [Streptomyces sp. HUAS 2-6]WBO65375.1 hypothetical protein O1G22_22405 [Streptomyces sp. HUAS 2-6]
MTQECRRTSPHRKIAAVSAVLLAVAAVAGCTRLWDGEPYPVADPVATATRLDGYTQAVYDALDLPDAELEPGGSPEADGYGCSYRGLRHLDEELSDSPGSPPGVVDVSSGWALKGVSRAEAVSAMQRARAELTRQGWKVAGYENSRSWLRLSLKPVNGEDTVSVEAYPGDRLQVAAYAECARYPSGTQMNELGEPVLPPQVAPVQLRR